MPDNTQQPQQQQLAPAHTPRYTLGPWRATYDGSICREAAMPLAAAVVAYTRHSDAGTMAANAALIAAAPDMLAALQDAEFLLRKAGQLAGPMQDSFKRSAADARTAIAKAEGR